jgi:L-ascorbate 6-phosphate lactonase
MGLASDLKTLEAPPDGVRVFWLGHAGVAVKGPEGQLLHVDPYLTNSLARIGPEFDRVQPILIPPEELPADVILCTHDHEDHLNPPTVGAIAKAQTNATFVTPSGCVSIMEAAGVPSDRIVPLDAGESIELAGARITGVYTDHELFYVDGQFRIHGSAGYLIELAGVRILNLGDTGYTVEHHEIKEPDILAAPINGLYHLTSADDIALMARVMKPRMIFPVHYGVCEVYNTDPEDLRKALAEHGVDVNLLVLNPGDSFEYRSTGP